MRIYGNIYKVIETVYDGFYTVFTDKMIYKFEGKSLVPKRYSIGCLKMLINVIQLTHFILIYFKV